MKGKDDIRACGNCRFSNVIDKDHSQKEDGFSLECRRYAPRVICGSGTGFKEWEFPAVKASTWCGEYVQIFTGKRMAEMKENQEKISKLRKLYNLLYGYDLGEEMKNTVMGMIDELEKEIGSITTIGKGSASETALS